MKKRLLWVVFLVSLLGLYVPFRSILFKGENLVSIVGQAYDADTTFDYPPVVLMFLTYKNLSQETTWNKWHQQAKADFEEKLNIPLPLYAGAIHAWPAKFPDWIEDFGYGSWRARWGRPNASVDKLMRKALEYVPHRQAYFILMSDTSIPVKSFIDIYTEIVADPRTRVSIWSTEFVGCLPKTSAWFAFSREHVERLLSTNGLWRPSAWGLQAMLPEGPTAMRVSERMAGIRKPQRKRFKTWPKPQYAAQDELYTFAGLWVALMDSSLALKYSKVLQDRMGLVRLMDETKSEDGLMSDCRSEAIFPRSIRLTIQDPPDFRSHHFVFWYELREDVSRGFIGGGKTDWAHPMRFARTNPGLLKFLNDKSQVWFMRKVDRHSHVQNCHLLSETEFFEDWLGLSSEPRESATVWNGSIPFEAGKRERKPQSNTFIANPEKERCSLDTYLSALWTSKNIIE